MIDKMWSWVKELAMGLAMAAWIPLDLMIVGFKKLWNSNQYVRMAVIAAGALFAFMILYAMFNPAEAKHDTFKSGDQIFAYAWCENLPDAETALRSRIDGTYMEFVFAPDNTCYDVRLMSIPIFAVKIVKHVGVVVNPMGDVFWTIMEVESPMTEQVGFSWVMHVDKGLPV